MCLWIKENVTMCLMNVLMNKIKCDYDGDDVVALKLIHQSLIFQKHGNPSMKV